MPFRVGGNSHYRAFGRVRSEEEIAGEIQLMNTHAPVRVEQEHPAHVSAEQDTSRYRKKKHAERD